MLRIFLTLILLISFTNCSSISSSNLTKPTTQQDRKISLQEENAILLLAMDYSVRGQNMISAELFKQLYLKGAGDRYLIEYLKSLNKSGQYLKTIEEGEKFKVTDDDGMREIGNSFLVLGDYNKALEEYLKIKSPKENDLRVIAEIYFRNRDYKNSIKYLEKAYSLNPAKDIVLNLAKISYIYLGDREKAISYLNSHNKLYKFDRDVAKYLGKLYKDNGQYNEALKIYRELYAKEPTDEVAISIIQVLSYLSDRDELISFLEKSQFNNELLFRLYMSNGLYQEGYEFSKKILEKEKSPYVLAQNAIFEYELNMSKNIAVNKFLPSVVSKLEKSVNKINEPSFFNYLGYIMVDNNYRVKDGIKYIEKALSLEPDSYYIIDSLAWGEYKLGRCQEAYKNMKIVVDNLGLDDNEIVKHWNKIKSCKK